MTAEPSSLRAIGARVEERLAALLAAEQARWLDIDPSLGPPLDALAALVSAGGKRLRPAFCHWGFVGAGGDPCDPRPRDAGAAFELLHAFALFHDDVMDGSATRRGERTTHLVFADAHESAAWIGEGRRFGEGVAILVGDLAFVYADVLMGVLTPPAWQIWNELRVELNVGQYLDLAGTARRERRRPSTERIARYKSGRYTVERPLHLGALLAAPDRGGDLLEPLSEYGLPLGDAFQLRDDVLGAFGDATVTGKPVGDDLREGKPTTLLAIATARADSVAARLLERVGAPDLSEAEVAEIQDVLRATGAVDELEAVIAALAAEAIAAARRLPVVPEARDALVELAQYVAWRDR
jgi:geranylgeranyl diphosphate synthase, type I